MSNIKVCPHCGNHVEGKRIQSYSKKVTKTAIKGAVSVGSTTAGAAAGAAYGTAIMPGVGTAVGAALGTLGSAVLRTGINDGVDAMADAVTKAEYEFTCPKCGHYWIGQTDDDEFDYDESFDDYDGEDEYNVFIIKKIIADSLNIEYDKVVPKASLKELGADSTDVSLISSLVEEKFGVDITEKNINDNVVSDLIALFKGGIPDEQRYNPSLYYVKDIIEDITGESISDGDIEPSYNGLPDNSSITDAEQEYLDNIREFLEDDAEITPREHKMLDRIRQKLGISEERAKELEASLAKTQLTEDEQEYLDMYREYAEKGSVTEKERRRLDKFATAMGIQEKRMRELELTIK